MRRFLAVLGLAGACAHVEPPPGGPEDRDPPVLIATRPDTFAVTPSLTGPVVLSFDERLSERGVEEAVVISPLTSAPNVEHRAREVRVSLRRGWEPGRIYLVTVLPGLQDLASNRITQPITLVFSTGPAVPSTRLTGTVVDHITGRAEAGLRVEALPQADTLPYATASDSAGAFVFARIPAGAYRVRGYRDVNRNRILDAGEPFDSAAASVVAGAEAPAVRLAILPPDTTPPRVASARVQGQAIEVQFDDYLDPAQQVSPGQVQITGPGGQAVAVARARVGQIGAAAADTAAAETTTRRLPSQTLSVEPSGALVGQAEYRIRPTGVRNVRCLAGGGEATLRTPAAAPPP